MTNWFSKTSDSKADVIFSHINRFLHVFLLCLFLLSLRLFLYILFELRDVSVFIYILM